MYLLGRQQRKQQAFDQSWVRNTSFPLIARTTNCRTYTGPVDTHWSSRAGKRRLDKRTFGRKIRCKEISEISELMRGVRRLCIDARLYIGARLFHTTARIPQILRFLINRDGRNFWSRTLMATRPKQVFSKDSEALSGDKASAESVCLIEIPTGHSLLSMTSTLLVSGRASAAM